MITVPQAIFDMALAGAVFAAIGYIAGRAHQAWIDEADWPEFADPPASSWDRPLVILNGSKNFEQVDRDPDLFDWEADPELRKGD